MYKELWGCHLPEGPLDDYQVARHLLCQPQAGVDIRQHSHSQRWHEQLLPPW